MTLIRFLPGSPWYHILHLLHLPLLTTSTDDLFLPLRRARPIAQDDEVGDGTTSVVVLAGELLREAEKLVASKIHPMTIISSYRMTADCARSALLDKVTNNKKDSEKFRSNLVRIAKTTLSLKILLHDKEHFAKLAIDVVKNKKIGLGQPKRIENDCTSCCWPSFRGTVWKITKDGEDVIYAVDINHRKERNLNGTILESFVRPTVLITYAYNSLSNQPSRRQRDQEFLDAILNTLRGNGNVLLPVDTTVDYVKSFLEWMSDSIAKSFEHTRGNAFLLKHVTLLINKSELECTPEGPKIVLASMASLEVGFSHDIFVEWAADSTNLV
ncbi:hypothetical protein L2E82_24491 [Cichorium intybus]|uniref:Uncharacterized protein n=1 Tax=Cichorium intybus TaxID=13427 RepID=A0ACB9E1C1_CICIN|nr:hypothetical protein L2E82_24491 [Cichorium intybus]